MSEPIVEFELNNIQDTESRTIFESLRRWFHYREDLHSPASATFTGELNDGESVALNIPGVVYGMSGMTENTNGFWIPMVYAAGGGSNQCYFEFSSANINGSFVQVGCEGSALKNSLKFRATVLYRDA